MSAVTGSAWNGTGWDPVRLALPPAAGAGLVASDGSTRIQLGATQVPTPGVAVPVALSGFTATPALYGTGFGGATGCQATASSPTAGEVSAATAGWVRWLAIGK